MLPKIRQHARIAFGRRHPDAREEAVQAVVCNACAAIARLAELGKLDLAYASVLARYGVAQVKDGRMTGGHLNCKDVLSGYCQRLKDVVVERLDHYDEEENGWTETVVEDRTAGPAEIARVRLDFSDWLHQLPSRNRRIAQFLSLGHRTSEAARKFRVSEGRVSQLRRELAESWCKFIGDDEDNGGNAAA
jgi:hypothetical protein